MLAAAVLLQYTRARDRRRRQTSYDNTRTLYRPTADVDVMSCGLGDAVEATQYHRHLSTSSRPARLYLMLHEMMSQLLTIATMSPHTTTDTRQMDRLTDHHRSRRYCTEGSRCASSLSTAQQQ